MKGANTKENVQKIADKHLHGYGESNSPWNVQI